MSKPIHLSAFFGPDGAVSALCFDEPRAINLRKATWTDRDEAVTCPRCKVAIALGRDADEIAPKEAAALDALLAKGGK